MESGTSSFRVDFPDFSNVILQKLNQQRQLGQLCDISIIVQGHLFRAHKAVLAASSPYFCDQVLLKNSRRVVLPDVMNPRVFENILVSTYTGRLVMPAPEIVSYLTAASFLQMWNVVDKCTELLEGNPTVLCHKSNHSSDHQSPSSSNYNGLVESFEFGSGAQSAFQKTEELRDGENDEESPKDNELSSQLTEHEYLPSNSSTEHDRLSTEMTSQDGEEGVSDSAEYHYIRPVYSKPSIMSHKRWVHIKPERFDVDCQGVETHPPYEEHQVSDSMTINQVDPASQSSGISHEFAMTDKKVEELEAHPTRNSYDEQMDFYGASMEQFSGERADENHVDQSTTAGCGDSTDIATSIQEDPSHSGFSSIVYKLYPCQCGKSFTHKSQRDRHMSMHLGLRPYGCGVCGKKFKMKHHLVGHMKIHTGIKPYECNICGKRFMWRDSFHRHVTSCTKAYQASKMDQTITDS
uniref:Zinc finger and BTB domain-containing protein 43 n=1 Tax=Geotrypetes seraphini TaxID=260995 RepID=A0A6P8SB80_GEOSA|nr:zinc finger and BTB domain-containing protein 43 [Geotrypetes seraphini]XP_033815871.1 zinc finger and BTB domain-containing protein 43 [Geotrypetes seraphini]XP_033815872.1 zinc finger and BTB domain-containing protein 43 [Geotrypetes seraphini]XP_033815873.1 zinc finger and BTB domain-containing protein 43 [Geotrypetes seraphini]